MQDGDLDQGCKHATFECDDVTRRAHVSRKQRAAGYRTERPLIGCFVPPAKGGTRRGRSNPSVSSSRFSVGRDFIPDALTNRLIDLKVHSSALFF